ncbi:MAG: ATP-binding protein [Candidatus Moranbacteria bacterium]|jgi:predicted AAA+ superfamily ATPase|nr:ATP-binding protein [Sphingobacteriia bacterium]NLC30793.1 ATP-binding protein [Candidatus Moranbacteria bacterium]
MAKKRYLQDDIVRDLEDKMVFIGGPRQVGKTTLARLVGNGNYKKYAYLNWDNRTDRKTILSEEFPADAGLLIFDEIHKYKKWKNYIKGEYDKHKERFDIIVTGSARLDLYRRGGDSLMGRYHYLRLHPFSLSEVVGKKREIDVFKELVFTDDPKGNKARKIFDELFIFGGFPEPFLKKDMRTLRRFHMERLERLVKEDIRDLESVRDISAIQILVELLPPKVGSLLSLNSMTEDLQVTYKTVAHWMDILEKFYYHYRIYPYNARTIRSLKKEPKMYLWDWSQISDEAARFENIIASHLLKTVHYLTDIEGYKAELFFLRDIESRETDFLVTIDRKPWFSVEVKLSSLEISKPLKYFSDKLKIPFNYQVVKKEGIDYQYENIRVISADKFLSALI